MSMIANDIAIFEAAKADGPLAEVGRLAVIELEIWARRNKARTDFRNWLKDYLSETGDYYDDEGALPEDKEMARKLKKESECAQRDLTSARAATRRAAKKVAAALAPKQPEQQ